MGEKYEVGYRKPPKASRFKAGQSGNPKGRPRGSPNLATDLSKRVFPGTQLNPKKASEGEFETTKRGFRLATSVGGTLTGRGGGVLIVDDPIKANDAESEIARRAAIDWFRNTALRPP